MKISIEMTPKEARALAGLPDMEGVWDKVFSDSDMLKNKMAEVMKTNTMRVMDPFNITGWKARNEAN